MCVTKVYPHLPVTAKHMEYLILAHKSTNISDTRAQTKGFLGNSLGVGLLQHRYHHLFNPVPFSGTVFPCEMTYLVNRPCQTQLEGKSATVKSQGFVQGQGKC